MTAEIEGPDGRESVRSLYLVGCDGGSSPVRTAIGQEPMPGRQQAQITMNTLGRLAEVAAGLEQAYPERHRGLTAFTSGDSIELAEKLHDLIALPSAERAELGAAARRVAEQRWSWTSVSDGLLAPFMA